MSGLFITGTDTGAGKTVVTAALAVALSERGVRVGVMKPAESGCPREDGRLLPQDALFLLEASGSDAPLELVNPYALAEPLTPALAAEMEGVRIEIDRLRDCYRQLDQQHDVVLVEGAGGLLAPLTGDVTMLDLAAELDLPLLIVARNVLGVINHTALTVRVARARGLRVIGTVLNNAGPEDDLARHTNPDALRRWSGAPLLAELPYSPSLERETLKSLGERLPLETVLRSMRGEAHTTSRTHPAGRRDL